MNNMYKEVLTKICNDLCLVITEQLFSDKICITITKEGLGKNGYSFCFIPNLLPLKKELDKAYLSIMTKLIQDGFHFDKYKKNDAEL